MNILAMVAMTILIESGADQVTVFAHGLSVIPFPVSGQARALTNEIPFLTVMNAQTNDARQTAGMKAVVCTGNIADPMFMLVKPRAERLASTIFAGAGVIIEWHWLGSCPKDGMKIGFSTDMPSDWFPRALAYARPFNGGYIQIFYDRIQAIGMPPDRLLGHVLVHEITHILQGGNYHARSGIMRAQWRGEDLLAMRSNSLPFTPMDLESIRNGFALKDSGAGWRAARSARRPRKH